MTPGIADRGSRRQFRLLLRASMGRLMDAALASREIDAVQFAIWGVALVATLPFFHAVKMMGRYTLLAARRPELLEGIALSDRLFFIVYAMLASALLASVLWEALFPDRQDQEIVGVLPVRPSLLAAARLSAAFCVSLAFALIVAAPCAFFYMLNVATATAPGAAGALGWWPAVFAAHVLAMTAAGIFTFGALLALRGIAVLCVGADAAQRAATILQLVTIVALVEAFIFLPGILRGLSDQFTSGAAADAASWPPIWFVGLYARMAGPPLADVPGLAERAAGWTAAVLAIAVASYLLPARINARRALEARLQDRTGRALSLLRPVAFLVVRRPAPRAVFGFVLASLARSRRHGLTFATYLGMAIAVAGVRFMAAEVHDRTLRFDVPSDYMLSAPLVITFFLVFGLRAAFAVPTDPEANWTFRLAQPSSPFACINAVGVVMVLLAVLPVTAVWALVALSVWEPWTALAAATMHAASGVALVELTLVRCIAVPFTRGYAPDSGAVRIGWVGFIAALHVFAFRLDDLQLAAIGSSEGVALYVAGTAAVVGGARFYRRTSRVSLEFDAPAEDAAARLNLSQATG